MSDVLAGRQDWNIDTSHTSVELAVKHMGVFTVRASLGNVTGGVAISDGVLQSIEAVIDASTINSGNSDRDTHLKSGDFLNVEEYPTINFKSTEIQKLSGDQYRVAGALTIRGEAHPVTLEVETQGAFKDPFGLVRAGGTARGEISRKQWGLTWNQVLETGSLLVADEVKFTIDVQAVLNSRNSEA